MFSEMEELWEKEPERKVNHAKFYFMREKLEKKILKEIRDFIEELVDGNDISGWVDKETIDHCQAKAGLSTTTRDKWEALMPIVDEYIEFFRGDHEATVHAHRMVGRIEVLKEMRDTAARNCLSCCVSTQEIEEF